MQIDASLGKIRSMLLVANADRISLFDEHGKRVRYIVPGELVCVLHMLNKKPNFINSRVCVRDDVLVLTHSGMGLVANAWFENNGQSWYNGRSWWTCL